MQGAIFALFLSVWFQNVNTVNDYGFRETDNISDNSDQLSERDSARNGFTDASGGFTDQAKDFILQVQFPQHLLDKIPQDKQAAAIGVLSHDPRPSYQKQADRIYGLNFAGFDIRFQVNGDTLTVLEVS